MTRKNNVIRPSGEPQKIIKTVPQKNINDETPIILFTHFNGHSVKTNSFNNYYANREKAICEVYSFVSKIKTLQQKTIKELFNGKNKKQLHCHPIEKEREVARINNVLVEGYKFSKSMIENFENNYFEFGLDNGSRIIFVKIDNIFELLFIDNNHMIYKESSRLLKSKSLFDCPSCFGKINFDRDYTELTLFQVVEMMLGAYKNGEYEELTEFVEDLEELLQDSLVNQ